MADKNYTNKLGLDTSEFTKAIKEANGNLKVIAQQINATRLKVVGYNTAVDSLTKNVTEHTKKQDALQKKYDKLKDVLGENALETKRVEAELEKEKNALIKAEQALDDYKVGLKNTSDNCKDVCHALTQMEMVLYDVAKAITQKVYKALVDFTKETINTGMQFESAFAGVRKVTSGTEEDFKNLETEIRKTALEKPISADQLASIYQMGSQLGIAKEGLKDFSGAIIDLAKTSDLTEEAGATMIAQYANVTGLKEDEYRKFASTLSYLGSTTATTESSIMDFASRISGSAKLIGMSHQEILALSTALGSVGIKAEMGGSAISKIMNNIDVAVDKNSKDLQTWAQVAGMSSNEFANIWKTNVSGAFQAVLTGMAKFKDEGGSLNLLLEELDIKNIRQTETLKKLANASELLAEDMSKANEEWEKAAFLGESASQVYNTYESKIQSLKNSLAELQMTIYDNVKEPLAEAAEELSKFLQSDDAKRFANEFASAFKSVISIVKDIVKGLIQNFDKVIALIKAATSALIGMAAAKVTKGIIDLGSNIKSLITSLTSYIAKLFSATTAETSLATATGAATVAQNGLNVAMDANPIGAIVTVIGLLVSGLVMFAMNSEKATDEVKENTKALEDQHKQLVENREERERTIAGIDAEANRTQGLVNELKTLVDENGKVKEGYRSRVDEIIPLIEKATGTEIKLIDDQIDKYGDLMTTLDKVIAKKRLEAKINAYQGDYENAWKIKESNEKAILELNDQQALYDEYQELMKSKLTWGEDEKARYERIKGEFSDLGVDVRNLKQLDKFKNNLEKSRQEIAASEEEIAGVIDKYEGLIVEEYESNKYDPEKDQTLEQLKEKEKLYKEQLERYKTAIKNGSEDIKYEMVNSAEQELSTIQSKIKKMEELTYGKSGVDSGAGIGGTDIGSKSSTSKKEETRTSYQELLNQEKTYQTQLQNYLTAIKQGNSEITVEMVEDTKKKLDEVQKKVKDMKQLLGDNTVSTKLVLSDETYGGLVSKEAELKEQLATMQSELTAGNQNITTDMLNNVSKQIDQVQAKIKALKNEWDETGEDGEISDEFESENTNHISNGVIFGKGVLGENAVEMEGAGKDAAVAYLEGYKAEQARINEQIVLDAQNRALQEAQNYQIATMDPANIEVYNQTEKYLAESKQTSQAQGLEENAYKVVNAETWTLNQAIAAAMQIDFTVVGKYICDGIALGIEQNKHVVIEAVRAMMEEANSCAEEEEGIDSPSKVFYRYGRFMDLGLANGIRDYASTVSRQVQDMTSKINDSISLTNSQVGAKRYGTQDTIKGAGVTEINYNFTQNNTSAKSLDTLAIYQQSKSMLKRVARNQYV